MKLNIVGTFDGKNIKKDGMAELKFKFPYSEIANYASLLTVLNNPLKVAIETDGKKHFLGELLMKSIRVDKDGEATVVLFNDNNSLKKIDLALLIQKVVTVKFLSEV